MATNNTVTSVSVSSANLFQLAAQYLGDATQWSRIAALNGFSDFLVTGLTSPILIPPYDKNAGNGGIVALATAIPQPGPTLDLSKPSNVELFVGI